MRYVIAVAVLSATVVLGLSTWAARDDDAEAPAIIALSMPSDVYVGERVVVFGGIEVPAGRYELGLFNCQAGSCVRDSWGPLEGPREVWRSLGVVTFANSEGPAIVKLRVFDSDSVSERVVAVYTHHLQVHRKPGGE